MRCLDWILSDAAEVVQDRIGSIRGAVHRSSYSAANAELSTRAFYRHFDSKDQLVAAVFLEMARAEVLRLQQRMSKSEPVRAVAAWIDGRLDLALNQQIRADLRQMSLEAQNQMFAAPELVAPRLSGSPAALLVEQLTRGRDLGLFGEIDPEGEALSIQGVVWANVERHWATAHRQPSEIRERVQRFCLQGLGVAPDVIAAVLTEAPLNRLGQGSSR